MNKRKLASMIARETSVTNDQAEAVLDALSRIVTEEVIETGHAVVPGVCRINLRHRPERMVLNPATREKKVQPARRIAVTKPAARFSRSVM